MFAPVTLREMYKLNTLKRIKMYILYLILLFSKDDRKMMKILDNICPSSYLSSAGLSGSQTSEGKSAGIEHVSDDLALPVFARGYILCF